MLGSVTTKASAKLAVLFLALRLASASAPQTNFQYSYNNGHLSKIIDFDRNQITNAPPDLVGGIALITWRSRPVTSTLAIINFESQQATRGTAVTVQSQGVSGPPSSNTVQFKGRRVTVVSATGIKLVFDVSGRHLAFSADGACTHRAVHRVRFNRPAQNSEVGA